MKRITNTLNILQKNKIASSLQQTLENVCSSSINNTKDVVQRVVKTQLDSTELLLNQSILKAMFPRFSVKKSYYLDALKEYNIAEKISIENGKIPGDIRHIAELVMASRFSVTSDHIKEVILRDESDGLPLSNEIIISTSNKNPDLHIIYQNGIYQYRDAKTGNITDNSMFSGNLQEISYTSENDLYIPAITSMQSLNYINATRLNYLRTLNDSLRGSNALTEHINRIECLMPVLKESEIRYNKLVQDELFINISLHITYKINFSYYYGRIVNECKVNPVFYDKISPYITPEIFNDKKKASIFIARAILAYHETIHPIIMHIQATKGTSFDLEKRLHILKELDDKPIF